MQQGLHNGISGIKTKTEGQIIRENVFTFFNILNFALAAAVILVGSFRSAVFLGVIFANIFIGSFQSIRAKRTLDKLSIVSAPKAVVLREGQKREIPVEEVVLDDILALSAGNQICSDAVVAAGECEVNESLITGESDPILKRPGDSLLSGSFVVSGSVHAQVEHVGAENYATKIAGDAKYIKKRNSEIMDSIDRIVKWVGFGILPIGALLFWKQFFVLGDTLQNSVVSTTAAMVGMIPEGLVLLVSVCFAVSVVKLSARKTLVRDLYCVETLARVDVLCLDKTGTLTVGKPRVTAIHPATGISESELLTLAAAVEQGATHPLAQAIVREAQVAELAIPTAQSQRALVGSGIEAQVNGERVLICAAGKHPADAFAGLINELESAGQTVVLVVRNDDVLGVIALQDTLRADAATAISELNALGVKGVILTGDNPRAAAAIAGELGLEFKAGLLPEDKVKAVTELNQHAPLAMVGDGINDAPAMKAAAIGIAMGSGTDVALETADAALTHNHLRGLVQMIELARATHANIRQNITIALGLKGLFLVTTLLGMTGLWLAVLADTGATVLVTANALRLLRRK